MKSRNTLCSIRRRRGGFSLIEVMVVVIILGILAATIVPQFVGTTTDAKISKAKSDIAIYKGAVEQFAIAMDRYPSTEEGLRALIEAPEGEEENWPRKFVREVRPDPWGRPYLYAAPGRDNNPYDIWSLGADGQQGGEGPDADIGTWVEVAQ